MNEVSTHQLGILNNLSIYRARIGPRILTLKMVNSNGLVIDCAYCCGKDVPMGEPNNNESLKIYDLSCPSITVLLNGNNVDQLDLTEFDEAEYLSSETEHSEWNSSMNEQFEDLLDIISEDGDYMARIGADYLSKCIFCSWKGPILKLDHHIRTMHQDQIHKLDTDCFNGTFSIAGLLKQCKWNSMVIQTGIDGNLYVLSALHSKPNMLHVTLNTTIPDPKLIGSITVHNKSTGKPSSWKGNVEPVPYKMTTKLKGLHIKLSQLTLVPKSAGFKLDNHGQLMPLKPNGKILRKQEVFTDINITVYVKVNIR